MVNGALSTCPTCALLTLVRTLLAGVAIVINQYVIVTCAPGGSGTACCQKTLFAVTDPFTAMYKPVPVVWSGQAAKLGWTELALLVMA